jgi:hypothetical protein
MKVLRLIVAVAAAASASLVLMLPASPAARAGVRASCSVGKLMTVKKKVPASTSKAAWDAATKAAVAHDSYGWAELMLGGHIVMLGGGSKVRVLDRSWTHVVVRVERSNNRRILFRKLWVDCSWLY